ncbi:uncharacterized protein RJT21DRAFT_118563 [Scheffersomyces amazonensis]|uniref:uncharacterized protein n=1 Tax=Scheffersomyces amazonensis TaxID=1078765 RepID=UPI00315CD743
MEQARDPEALPVSESDERERNIGDSSELITEIHSNNSNPNTKTDTNTGINTNGDNDESGSEHEGNERLHPSINGLEMPVPELSNESSEEEEEEEVGEEDDDEDEDDYDEYDDEEQSHDTLSSTIIKEIQDGTYSCLVCTGEIDQFSQVWSCANCYRVYDLECINDWAIRGSSTNKTSKEWRCPSCNVATKEIPKLFKCWCGKVTNPEVNSFLPFSCGNTCSYQYNDCIHGCSSVCHPGSHPICGALGPLMKCHCAKQQRQLPCLITPYEQGWQCDEPCDTTICLLGHSCQRGCHSGLCGPCNESLSLQCYCGKNNIELNCSTINPKQCHDNKGKSWIGSGQCLEKTILYYDCDIHFEELDCQPLPESIKVCKLSPSQISTCYCGQTPVDVKGRTKCTDPIPECDRPCNKLLPCGCKCLLKCHPGDCECFNILDIKCPCGHGEFSVPCKFIQQGYKPRCDHKCSVLLNCRKHYHREQCCAFEQIALKREREKKKAIRNNIRSNFNDEVMNMEAVHICTKTCNRLKPCGKHYCEALCHNGPCPVCLESTNEELICHCGKTIIEPPIRCGTKLICHEQCIRHPICGHRPERHECHEDSVSCPKCTVLVKKECNCGLKSDLPGILCSQENVSCGTACKKLKSCGHACLRVCSSKCTVDDIHNSSTVCQSPCEKRRINCPHSCKLICHANKPGQSIKCDARKCPELVQVNCECGLIKRKIPCGASLDEQSVIGTIIECTEECERAKRDAELRSAFDVSDELPKVWNEDIPYPDSVMSTYIRQSVWCNRIENLIRTFIEDYQVQIDNHIKSPKRTHHFPPMSSPQRSFIHELADTYNLYSESQDEEPKRSTFIVITRNTKLPLLTIQECIRMRDDMIRERNKAAELKQAEIEAATFNALVIQDVFFGIVIDDLKDGLSEVVSQSGIVKPTFQWIKDSTFVFYSEQNYKTCTTTDENQLYLLMKSFKNILRMKSLAFDCKLCLIDDDATYILKVDSKLKSEKSPSPAPIQVARNDFEVLQEEENLAQA